MGYPKGVGPRKCGLCGEWFEVYTMQKIGSRFYCSRDVPVVKSRRSLRNWSQRAKR